MGGEGSPETPLSLPRRWNHVSWPPRKTVGAGSCHGAGIPGARPSVRRGKLADGCWRQTQPQQLISLRRGKAAKATGPRSAGEHLGLAACLLSSGCSPHFLLVKFLGETIWGTGSPDCVVITQKWLLFSAIFKFMFQLCHFLCVTLALPGLSCHL